MIGEGADGQARITALATDLVLHSDSRLDADQLRRFLNSFQTVAPLTIGELWAWPSALTLALIASLRTATDEVLDGASARARPPTKCSRAAETARRPVRGLARDAAPRAPRADAASAARVQPVAERSAAGHRTAPLQPAADERRHHPHRTAAAGGAAGLGGQRRSPACGCARRSTGASTSRPSARSSARSGSTRPARIGAWIFSAAIACGRPSRRSRGPAGDDQVRVAGLAVAVARECAQRSSPADRAAHVGFHLIDAGRDDFEARARGSVPVGRADCPGGAAPRGAALSRPRSSP